MQDFPENRKQDTAEPISHPITSTLVRGLRAYKRLISPLLPASCRFSPTCSEYAGQAIEKHGALKGSLLSAKRLLRCNRLFSGGFDPVP